jgi:hypothetical protein
MKDTIRKGQEGGERNEGNNKEGPLGRGHEGGDG